MEPQASSDERILDHELSLRTTRSTRTRRDGGGDDLSSKAARSRRSGATSATSRVSRVASIMENRKKMPRQHHRSSASLHRKQDDRHKSPQVIYPPMMDASSTSSPVLSSEAASPTSMNSNYSTRRRTVGKGIDTIRSNDTAAAVSGNDFRGGGGGDYYSASSYGPVSPTSDQSNNTSGLLDELDLNVFKKKGSSDLVEVNNNRHNYKSRDATEEGTTAGRSTSTTAVSTKDYSGVESVKVEHVSSIIRDDDDDDDENKITSVKPSQDDGNSNHNNTSDDSGRSGQVSTASNNTHDLQITFSDVESQYLYDQLNAHEGVDRDTLQLVSRYIDVLNQRNNSRSSDDRSVANEVNQEHDDPSKQQQTTTLQNLVDATSSRDHPDNTSAAAAGSSPRSQSSAQGSGHPLPGLVAAARKGSNSTSRMRSLVDLLAATNPTGNGMTSLEKEIYDKIVSLSKSHAEQGQGADLPPGALTMMEEFVENNMDIRSAIGGGSRIEPGGAAATLLWSSNRLNDPPTASDETKRKSALTKQDPPTFSSKTTPTEDNAMTNEEPITKRLADPETVTRGLIMDKSGELVTPLSVAHQAVRDGFSDDDDGDAMSSDLWPVAGSSSVEMDAMGTPSGSSHDDAFEDYDGYSLCARGATISSTSEYTPQHSMHVGAGSFDANNKSSHDSMTARAGSLSEAGNASISRNNIGRRMPPPTPEALLFQTKKRRRGKQLDHDAKPGRSPSARENQSPKFEEEKEEPSLKSPRQFSTLHKDDDTENHRIRWSTIQNGGEAKGDEDDPLLSSTAFNHLVFKVTTKGQHLDRALLARVIRYSFPYIYDGQYTDDEISQLLVDIVAMGLPRATAERLIEMFEISFPMKSDIEHAPSDEFVSRKGNKELSCEDDFIELFLNQIIDGNYMHQQSGEVRTVTPAQLPSDEFVSRKGNKELSCEDDFIELFLCTNNQQQPPWNQQQPATPSRAPVQPRVLQETGTSAHAPVNQQQPATPSRAPVQPRVLQETGTSAQVPPLIIQEAHLDEASEDDAVSIDSNGGPWWEVPAKLGSRSSEADNDEIPVGSGKEAFAAYAMTSGDGERNNAEVRNKQAEFDADINRTIADIAARVHAKEIEDEEAKKKVPKTIDQEISEFWSDQVKPKDRRIVSPKNEPSPSPNTRTPVVSTKRDTLDSADLRGDDTTTPTFIGNKRPTIVYNEGRWIAMRNMGIWNRKKNNWLPQKQGKTSSKEVQPRQIDGVKASSKLCEYARTWYSRPYRELAARWQMPCRQRTNRHPGYLGVHVNSLYDFTMVNAQKHRHDKLPWEHRDVKQRFLDEVSVAFRRNWFGRLRNTEGNPIVDTPVCRPKSMEMPMRAPDWTDEWFRPPKLAPLDTNISGSYDTADMPQHHGNENSRSQKLIEDDDSDSWEDTPECGTLKNVRLKPGDRISRLTPDLTSSVRRSRWRKKHFPRGIPY
ncbi:hypothetical protein ACA910_001725 [Epithemia clementina (nom. ined.)]